MSGIAGNCYTVYCQKYLAVYMNIECKDVVSDSEVSIPAIPVDILSYCNNQLYKYKHATENRGKVLFEIEFRFA